MHGHFTHDALRIAPAADLARDAVPAQEGEQQGIAAAHAGSDTQAALESVAHLDNYQVVELRRYDIAPGQRDRFVRYFDAYFPEAFEQLDCMVFGQFEDRATPTKFVWLRGYHDINARPVTDAAFYYGPVWREHRTKVNALFPGASDNVLLLRPLTRQTEVPVLPAVDPVDEPHGARGVAVVLAASVAVDVSCGVVAASAPSTRLRLA